MVKSELLAAVIAAAKKLDACTQPGLSSQTAAEDLQAAVNALVGDKCATEDQGVNSNRRQRALDELRRLEQQLGCEG